ncbi:hypothetical protein PG995_006512 [Apiospora arundinis]|uniref:Uncharacterized protein n=1 Tax=Apiospora arundinis TaxID=335852 RepID=A0ABR2JJG0_9PEZI
MKYATAAATLLPLAWAANIDARAGKDSKFNISKLEAGCDSDKGKCFYNFEVGTGDSDSTTSCKAETITSTLGAAPETKCGSYSVSVAKPHDGGLLFIVDEGRKGLTGSFTVYPKDLKEDGDKKTYKDGSVFNVAAKATLPITEAAGEAEDDISSAVGSAVSTATDKVSTIASHAAMMPPTATAKASSIASHVGAAQGSSGTAATGAPMTASSIPSTAVSGVSTMVKATSSPTASGSSDEASSTSDSKASSSSSSSSASSTEEASGATRQSAFAGVMAIVGLVAFAF